MKITDTIKARFFWQGIRVPSGVRFQCYDVRKTSMVLVEFSPFIINYQEHLFVETEIGLAVIDVVDETGIHVLYFTGKGSGQSEWIRSETHQGTLTRTKRTLIHHK